MSRVWRAVLPAEVSGRAREKNSAASDKRARRGCPVIAGKSLSGVAKNSSGKREPKTFKELRRVALPTAWQPASSPCATALRSVKQPEMATQQTGATGTHVCNSTTSRGTWTCPLFHSPLGHGGPRLNPPYLLVLSHTSGNPLQMSARCAVGGGTTPGPRCAPAGNMSVTGTPARGQEVLHPQAGPGREVREQPGHCCGTGATKGWVAFWGECWLMEPRSEEKS